MFVFFSSVLEKSLFTVDLQLRQVHTHNRFSNIIRVSMVIKKFQIRNCKM